MTYHFGSREFMSQIYPYSLFIIVYASFLFKKSEYFQKLYFLKEVKEVYLKEKFNKVLNLIQDGVLIINNK